MNFKKIVLLLSCFVCLFAKANNIELSFNYTLTTSLIHPPYVSGVIGDKTDPAATLGVYINIVSSNGKPIAANNFEAIAITDDVVLFQKNITISKSNGLVTVKITPDKIGFSNLFINVKNGKEEEKIEINYAASNTGTFKQYWHTGISDASAAMQIGNNKMLVADDENNLINLYSIEQSGLPEATFNYTNALYLPDQKNGVYKEVDCEAMAISPTDKNKVYWLGSMSNGGKDLEAKANRSSIFYTNLKSNNDKVELKYSPNYLQLKKQIIKWGDAQGFNFSKCSQTGQTPKSKQGFNMEAASFSINKKDLLLGLRAPVIKKENKEFAIIIPVKNFETWFNDGKPSSPAQLDSPILLNLGGRGFRDMFPLPNGKLLIVAGDSGNDKTTALFYWSGNANEQPTMIDSIDVATLSIEAGFAYLHNGVYNNEVVLITDSGSKDYYNNGMHAKDLHPNFKKFNTLIIQLPSNN